MTFFYVRMGNGTPTLCDVLLRKNGEWELPLCDVLLRILGEWDIPLLHIKGEWDTSVM